MTELSAAELGKFAAAFRAADFVKDGMKIGLGTGSTAAWLVKVLADRKAQGLSFRACATSDRTAELARSLGILIEPLDDLSPLDLAIDGADEFDPDWSLIKGGGGALLQEKIVEAAAKELVVITDASKEVEALGAFPLPIEIVRFGWRTTKLKVEAALAEMGYHAEVTRRGDATPFVTDEGHYIFDLKLGRITDVPALHNALVGLPGVVETGLFIDMATAIVIGSGDGDVRVMESGKEPVTDQLDLKAQSALISRLMEI